ncbi:MAG: hypothetical protein AB8B93_12450 [Pseudomonadales bacterium]
MKTHFVTFCLLAFACTSVQASPQFERLRELLGRGAGFLPSVGNLRSAYDDQGYGCSSPALNFQLTGGPEPMGLFSPVTVGFFGGVQVELASSMARTTYKLYGMLGVRASLGISGAFPISLMGQCEASPWWVDEFATAFRWKAAFGLAFAGPIHTTKPDSVGVSMAYRGSISWAAKKQFLACSLYAQNGEVQHDCE